MLMLGPDNFYKLAIYLYQHKALDERNSQAWVGALTAFLLPSPSSGKQTQRVGAAGPPPLARAALSQSAPLL